MKGKEKRAECNPPASLFILPGTFSAGQCLAFAERISKTYADKFLELQFGIPTILGG